MKKHFLIAVAFLEFFNITIAQASAPNAKSSEKPLITTNLKRTKDAYSWNGLYLGLSAGLFGARFTGEVPNGIVNPLLTKSRTGVVMAGYVGYNSAINKRWLIGIDTDFALPFFYNLAPQVVEHHSPLSNAIVARTMASAVVKLGYVEARNVAFVELGTSVAKMTRKSVLLDRATISNQMIDSYSVGLVVGVGLDYELVENTIFRLEYRYSIFAPEEETLRQNSVSQVAKAGEALYKNVRLATNEFRVSIAYRF